MQVGPAGFAAALAARLTPTAAAVVAGPGVDVASASGWAESITVTRELSGELPDAASTVVGGVSGTLEARGDAYAAGAPSPLRTSEVRAWLRSAVSVAAGYAGLTVPVFTGTVADLDASELSGDLVLSARDAADRLTEPASLPAYGSMVEPRALGSIIRYPTNTQAVITHLLHLNGIRITPAPRAGCVLSVPGVGGWLAERGWTMSVGQSAPASWLTAGRFGSMPNVPAQTVRGWTATQCTYTLGYTMIEAFVRPPASGTKTALAVSLSAGGSVRIDLEPDRALFYSTSGASSTYIISPQPITAGWNHIAFEVRANNFARVWINGVFIGETSSTWLTNPGSGFIENVSWGGADTQSVQVHYSTSLNPAPSSDIMSFVPRADVSRGALDLDSVPDVDGANSWDVLKEIAQAELGMVGFDETGRFFFRNRAELAANVTPVATWDVDLVDDIKAVVSVDAILTRATARTRRMPGVDSGIGGSNPFVPVPALIADRPLTIPPGSSSVILSASAPFTPSRQVVGVITAPGVAWETPSGMALCTTINGSARYTGTDVRAWVVPISQTSVRVTFFNAGSTTVYAVWPDLTAWNPDDAPYGFKPGSPAFWLLGTRFTDEAVIETVVDRSDAAGVAAWGTQLHAFGDSKWWQDAATVDTFLAAFLADTSSPRASIGDITVPADPRWQLGDAVRVEDFRGRVPGFVARITSSRLVIDRAVENGLIGTYGLRQIPGPVPEVTVQPVSASTTAGSSVTFTATADGDPSPVAVWQVNDGTGWRDV